jgi:hypothetical protein
MVSISYEINDNKLLQIRLIIRYYVSGFRRERQRMRPAVGERQIEASQNCSGETQKGQQPLLRLAGTS